MTLRHRFTAVLGAAALLGLLSACAAGTPPEASAPPTASTGDSAFPATIEHIYGTATIPSEPERIVALGVTDADAVLALGGTVIANTGYTFYEKGLGPWTTELIDADEVTDIRFEDAPNLEQIAALKPDLILAVSSGIDEKSYAQLERIAPTVARPAGSAPFSAPRAEQTLMIAEALGDRAAGEALNTTVDEAFAAARDANPAFTGKTGAAVLPYDNQYGAFLSGDARGQFLVALGFTLPEAITAEDDGSSFFTAVSPENVSMLDGDVLLVLGQDEKTDIVADTPAIGALDVARAGAILPLSLDERGAITYNSPLSIPFAIDKIVPRIAEVVR